MPRPKRIDYPGARHHVMNRGARREPVFLDDSACGMFVGLLSELPKRYGVFIHGFALMPNHYHLMLESTRGEFSRAMAYFQGRYVSYLNHVHGWDGPLFKGRFKNRVVYREEYWMYLLIYLHLNPVRARLTTTAAQAPWTSHKYYARKISSPDWLRTDELKEIFAAFGGYRHYLGEVMRNRGEKPDGFDSVAFDEGRSTSAVTEEVTRVAAPVISAELAIEEVLRASGVPLAELTKATYGPKGNPARKVAAYWLACESAWGQTLSFALLMRVC